VLLNAGADANAERTVRVKLKIVGSLEMVEEPTLAVGGLRYQIV
jgi:hypothetical protein